MPNPFGADLFGNRIPQDFNPEWQDPSSGVVDVGGNVVGSQKLSPYDYSSQATANQMGGVLGLPVQTAMASGPGASANPQYELATSTPGHALNAGRAAQQMQYATKGRYNQDTGQYDKEDPAVVMARLKADIAPPLLGSQQIPGNTISTTGAYSYPNYIGQHPTKVGGGENYRPMGGTGQAPVRTSPMTPPASTPGGSAQPTGGGGAASTTNPAARRVQMAALLRARLRGGSQTQRPS